MKRFDVWHFLDEFKEETEHSWKFIGDLAIILLSIASRFEKTVEFLKSSSISDIMGEVVKSLEMIQRDLERIERETDKINSVDTAGRQKPICLRDIEYWSIGVREVLSLAREAEEAIRKYSETRSALESSLSSFFKAARQLLDNLLGVVGAEPARYYAVQFTLSIVCRAVLATRRGLEELRKLGYRTAEIPAVFISISIESHGVNIPYERLSIRDTINLKGLDISSLYSEIQRIRPQVEQWIKSRPIIYLSVRIDKDDVLKSCDNVRTILEADVRRLYEVVTKAVMDIHSRGSKHPG